MNESLSLFSKLLNHRKTLAVFFHWLICVRLMMAELISSRMRLLTTPISDLEGLIRRHVGWSLNEHETLSSNKCLRPNNQLYKSISIYIIYIYIYIIVYIYIYTILNSLNKQIAYWLTLFPGFRSCNFRDFLHIVAMLSNGFLIT